MINFLFYNQNKYFFPDIPAPINKLTTNSFPKTHSVIVEWEAPNNYLDHSEFCSRN